MIRRIILINAYPAQENSEADESINSIVHQLTADGYSIAVHKLTGKNIRQCVGCWDCWWTTPGICRFKDDVAGILRDTINADLIIYCTPLMMGMYSALLKKLHDRMIPLIHPYIAFIRGECHHRKRYPAYPKMGVILEKKDASADEIENTCFIFNRIALNFHSEVKFFHLLTEINAKILSDEISRI